MWSLQSLSEPMVEIEAGYVMSQLLFALWAVLERLKLVDAEADKIGDGPS